MSQIFRSAIEITPDDDNDLDPMVSAIYVGKKGDISLILAKNDTAVTLKDVPDGTILHLAVKRVLATGTDADFLVGLN